MTRGMPPQPDFVFAVDGGASKTEAQLRRWDGAVLATSRTGPCNLFQNPDAGLAAIDAAWRQCCTLSGVDPATSMAGTWLSAGIAGINGPGAKSRFHAAFAGFGRRLLSSDGYTGLVGAFGAAPGAMLSIGTGVVGCRLDLQGRFASLGGWGFPVGDHGSGAWIGLRVASAWLEHRDGIAPIGSSAPLWRALVEELGDDRPAILASLRGAVPSRYAALAPLVLQAAASGDGFATSVLNEAACHLAALARALAPDILALGGGLAGPMTPWLERALAGTSIALAHDVVPSSVDGAFRIAQGIRPPEFTTA